MGKKNWRVMRVNRTETASSIIHLTLVDALEILHLSYKGGITL